MLPEAFKCSAPVRTLLATSSGYISREWDAYKCRWYRVQQLIERERARLGEHKPACLQPAEHSKGGLQLVEHFVDTAKGNGP